MFSPKQKPGKARKFSKSIPQSRYRSLVVEELEPRCLPTILYWYPHTTIPVAGWYDHVLIGGGKEISNWDTRQTLPGGATQYFETNNVPGPGDFAVFTGANADTNKNCYLSTFATVSQLIFSGGYTSTLYIAGNGLSGGAGLTVTSQVSMASNATISGEEAAFGVSYAQLWLGSSANFYWQTGSLVFAQVNLRSSSNFTIPTTIAGLPYPQMQSTTIQVDDKASINWLGQNVGASTSSGGPNCAIDISPGGNFNITASGQTWGANPAYLKVTNQGTINVKTRTQAVLNANFTTSGTTNLNGGDLLVSGTAQQTAGLFNLNGGSFTPGNSATLLNIFSGNINGYGTVNGNLTLGNGSDDVTLNPANAPSIVPGSTTGKNIINITGCFQMFSGTMIINIPNNAIWGNVKVIGYAALGAAGNQLGGSVVGAGAAGLTIAIIPFLTYSTLESDFKDAMPPGTYSYQSPLTPKAGPPGVSQFILPPPPPPATSSASVSGTVFVNNDGTNVPDSSNPGLSGATTEILNSSDSVVASTTSGSGGTYSFSGITPGTYTEQVTVPSGYVVNGSSNTESTTIVLDYEQTLTNNIAAYSSSSTTGIAGNVFIDDDASGIAVYNNPGFAGATVSLETSSGGTVTDASGHTVNPATTNSSGNYSFANLVPGSYEVIFDQPSGYLLEGTSSSTWTEAVNAPGPNTIVNEGVYQDASISGTVTTRSSGLSGVTVELTDLSGDVLASTTTASNGTYSLSSLAPGSYGIVMTAPTGYVFYGTSNTLSTFTMVGSAEDLTGLNAAAFSSSAATSISGTVFIDNDGTGGPDCSNSGLSGVTVTLETSTGGTVTNASDETVEPATTNSSGQYSFTDLVPGTYTVVVSQPTGYSLEGSSTSTWSTLVAAPNDSTIANEGVYQSASVSGTISYGSGDLAGVTVTLMDTEGNLYSTTSASNGTFSISGLAPGWYDMELVAPSGYVFNGSDNTLDSNILLGSDQSLTGQNATAYSATAATTITGTVFSDVDGTGGPDSSNPNLSGVTVTLEDDNGDSVTNASGGTVEPATTNSSGVYTFSNLNAGSYQVVVSAPTGYVAESTYGTSVTIATASPGAGSTVNAAMIQDGGFSGNVSESGGLGGGGIYDVGVALQDDSGDTVASTDTDSSGNFSLSDIAPGFYTAVFTTPSGYILNGSSNTWSETVYINSGVTNSGNDITAYSSLTSTSISGNVFIDDDGSNSDDGTNPGISGVTVTLLEGTTTISSTTTNSSGNYSFSMLSPGTYTVKVTEPSGYSLEGSSTSTWTTSVSAPGPVTTADEGVYQSATLGGTVSVSGGSGLSGTTVTLYDMGFDQVATTTTASGGTFSFTGVVPGSYFIAYEVPTGYVMDGASDSLLNSVTVGSDQTISNLNATAYSASGTYSLTGTVYIDENGDWNQDSGDAGLSGVTVALLDEYGNLILNGSGDPITTTTNSSGEYTIGSLNPGSYQLEFTMPSGSTYLTDASGASTWTGSANTPGPYSSLNVGVYQTSTVSGTVFLDNGGTATPGGGNTAESGISVTVLDQFGNTVTTTTTNSSGDYSFSAPPGTYTMQLGIPGDDSIEGSSDDNTAPITIASGETYSNVYSGIVQPPETGGGGGGLGGGGGGLGGGGGGEESEIAIGGFAWSDTNDSGLRSLNESTVGGITVELLNSLGSVLATTSTNDAGYYQFGETSSGTYQIRFIIPTEYSGAAFSTQNASSDQTTSSSANSSGYTADFTLSTGQLWLDENVGLTGISV
jgi:serine-aspartate repeat-containing protein C/D/E